MTIKHRISGEEGEPVLTVRDLRVTARDRFGKRRGLVNGVDFTLHKGETLAVVGETGCGKSVLGAALTQLVAGARCRGKVHLGAQRSNLLTRGEWRLGKVRGGEISYIFGGLRDSLHSHVSVRDQMKEVLNRHRPEVKEMSEEISYWMSKVGVAEPETAMGLFAWQLDAVTRTRVSVAMAMCTFPVVLVADEPAAGLDQSNQDEILDLIGRLTATARAATLLLTRDFRVLCRLADRVAVMQAGRFVESGELSEVMVRPQHDFTRRMLAVTPGMEAAPPPKMGDGR